MGEISLDANIAMSRINDRRIAINQMVINRLIELEYIGGYEAFAGLRKPIPAVLRSSNREVMITSLFDHDIDEPRRELDANVILMGIDGNPIGFYQSNMPPIASGPIWLRYHYADMDISCDDCPSIKVNVGRNNSGVSVFESHYLHYSSFEDIFSKFLDIDFSTYEVPKFVIDENHPLFKDPELTIINTRKETVKDE